MTKTALKYFTENEAKMRYGLFSMLGLSIGSGMVESACKSVIGTRLKDAGMHWTKEMAERMVWLLCALHSGQYDQYFDEGRTVRIVCGKTVRPGKLAA